MHEDMIRAIEDHVLDTRPETGREALSGRVLDAMRRVPRERFVPQSEARFAYSDSPLPIGFGQTISQPFIVALMTDLIEPQPHHRVLEVGSGSGYQVAVLAHLVEAVYGMEIVPQLAERSARVLRELGYHNATIRSGDGYHGWSEHAPFDGILVAAAGSGVSPALQQQLRVGGKLVLPLESAAGWQSLDVIERVSADSFKTRHILPVRFVPLTGKH